MTTEFFAPLSANDASALLKDALVANLIQAVRESGHETWGISALYETGFLSLSQQGDRVLLRSSSPFWRLEASAEGVLPEEADKVRIPPSQHAYNYGV